MVDVQLEREREARYPISRWYVRPAAGLLARCLNGTCVRPSHLTALGAVWAAAAVAILCVWPEAVAWAAIPVWLAWFMDRADGMLARAQKTVSAWGAWFDANIDELVDLAFQVAVTFALARQVDAPWPWFVLVGFLGGKYLLMYGLMLEELEGNTPSKGGRSNTRGQAPPLTRAVRYLYHLPGNCDVRVHWLILMLAIDQLAIELVVVTGYYNLRWIVRYATVWRRSRRAT